MNVLMLSAEVAPFATVGGLSQVLFFLSSSLLKAGHDVRTFTPLHGKIRHRDYKTHVLIDKFIIPTETLRKNQPENIECTLRLYKSRKPNVYFLENREYYTLRENVFGYADDHQRFYLMCKAALEWLLIQIKNKDWVPDVIHAHDWHAGYFVELARTDKRYKKLLHHIPILYTIHNFHYQGNMDFAYLPPKERDKGNTKLRPMLDEKMVFQNSLLRGILHADWINTVSPTHAIEVLTEEYGERMDPYLLKRRGVLSGIINGLDHDTFDPEIDPLVEHNFSLATIEKRKANKLTLQKEFALEQNDAVPLLAFCGRLTQQKGAHLILDILEHLIIEMGIQFVVLGGGESQIANGFYKLSQKYPKNIGTHLYPNFKLPRKIFAGSDAIMMPSIFEPGGIVALEAMRYGCVPIVRSTGGLKDVIRDFDPETKLGNGFSFTKIDSQCLLIATIRMLESYRNKKLWKNIVTNAMKEDFSWDYSMHEYVKLYKKAISINRLAGRSNPSPAFKA